jgi:phenylpropionate dioxygenase-like ring-hydroxylating dioxygenase large terminal subunit
MLFTNQWYVVSAAEDVGARPVAVRALGQEIVLFRRASDRGVVALSDRCPHRMARLAEGQIEGDTLRCPYHRWAFAADGACVHVPSEPDGTRIPPRARVDSYPVVERDGWIWAFLGDLPEAERPAVPEVPGLDLTGWRAVRGQWTWRAHYTRVVENAVDIAHTPFLHARSFGNPQAPVMPDHGVIEAGDAISIDVSLPMPTPRGLARLLFPPGANRVRLGVWPPAVNWLDATFPNGWRMVLLLANLPVDEGHTRTFWLQRRNFFTSPIADPIARALSRQILGEDLLTVEGQGSSAVPLTVAEELSTRSDVLSLAYRRRLAAMQADRLDAAAAARAAAAGRYLALPSPERRTRPGAWVVPAAPTVDAAARASADG